MCNWFQNKSPTHTFAVDWDTWHGNWAAPCYFNGALPTGSAWWDNCLQRHLACEGLYPSGITCCGFIGPKYGMVFIRRRNPFLSGSHLNQTVVRRNIFTGYDSGKTKHIIENSYCMYVSISAIHENAENNELSLKTTMGIINYKIKWYTCLCQT